MAAAPGSLDAAGSALSFATHVSDAADPGSAVQQQDGSMPSTPAALLTVQQSPALMCAYCLASRGLMNPRV